MKKLLILCLIVIGLVCSPLINKAMVMKLADPAIGMFINPSIEFLTDHESADPAIGMSYKNNMSM
ncbi:hypothetical protein CJZ71_07380 [Bacillus subtilis]|uniref:hypothetical protein n=1 Tax=Bacillus subtilis TaxID=1423 RepID=UPI00085290F9|nr:hypothetical protein [Bacillus subtilis]AOS69315.1 hypothetical protein A4A60_17430 [Bacillus subtilis]ARW33039.1 hypothetical protein S101441_03519 [Bacillus subtilis subsp. subtilis]ASV02013.1 hypothetical protein CJZ71_07380 [Bacillus subtilis]AYK65211.1 hypothetical protein D9C11_06610 [Bacillus subtilis subsp. subtilis]AYK72035.1 hypothetical protein D9C09_21140 [Bacillus subtilis subsp. subtilis]